MRTLYQFSKKSCLLSALCLSPLLAIETKGQTNITSPVISSITGTASNYTAQAMQPLSSDVLPATNATYHFGTNNKKLTSFKVGDGTYNLQSSQSPSSVVLRRNISSGYQAHGTGALFPSQQAIPWGDRQSFYAEGTLSGTTFTLIPSYPGTPLSAANLEGNIALMNGFANVGTDNTFVNQEYNADPNDGTNGAKANVTANNVERIDFLWNTGIAVTIGNINSSGIILANRGQNDDAIKIAAIKALSGGTNTGAGTNYLYDDVLSFNNTWTQKGVNGGALSGAYTPTTIISQMSSIALRRRDEAGSATVNDQLLAATRPTVVNSNITIQDVKAMFLSFADLGLSIGDTFHGYSVLPNDANVGGDSRKVNSFLDTTIYPTNTPNDANGADLSAINGYFLAQNLSGTIWNDANGSAAGTFTNIKTGAETATNAGGLFAILVDATTGKVLMSTAVKPDGTYLFQGVPPTTNVKIYLSTSNYTAGQTGPTTSTLPTDWIFTSAPSYSGTYGFSTGNADITGKDFGIEKIPVAVTQNYILPTQPAANSAITLNGTGTISSPGPLIGSDFEDGMYNGISGTNTVIIQTLPTHGTLYYDVNGDGVLSPSEAVTAGQTIPSYNPDKLIVKFTGSGYTSLTFTYSEVDAAGQPSVPANYTISFPTPLPVKLVSFSVSQEGNSAQLNWTTAGEINADRFEIERSADAKTWNYIGKKLANGTSISKINYYFADNTPISGTVYYRIKMIDKDETYAFSHIESIRSNTIYSLVTVYPNPVTEKLYIQNVPLEKLKEVSIVNASGILVYKSASVSGEGISVENFSTGIYIVKVLQTDGTLDTQKIIVTR
ncbi:T9SS type A sorting domain-containing protein [Dyadobacter sp. LHD-138]|uniref:T9SS type A sorting domain-containing protein n=1 Tax=Dyadobacter sp. LHD-138 TaxID=3071413 RepID=UPI0027E176E7|nr:T9SS type A sorting domain-containing protein [Dyadobacter sp. LHD-138]MDQ6481796.1 T9SS type A sorting domain-containing protein [Dyadobacter sp. LHD-138]